MVFTMKVPILIKLLIIMLILTVVPLGIMGYLALQDEKSIGMNAANNAQKMGDVAIADSTKALENLGEKIITEKAKDAANQLTIYIKSHPTLTLRELQNDTEFQNIAVQKLGERGYITTVDGNNTVRFHPNPKMVNYDTHQMCIKYPDFCAVSVAIDQGVAGGGYYNWPDPDGVTRSKYMFIQPTNVTTADGVHLYSAATTYMEEFTQPSRQLEQKMNTSIQKTVSDISVATESMSSQNTILMITLISMFIVIIIVFILATSISRPIKQLTEIADKVSMGDLETEITVHTNDEINDLAESFRRMINAFKMMVSMQDVTEEEDQ